MKKVCFIILIVKYQMKLITKAALDSSEASLKKLENQIQTSIASLIV